MKKLSLVLACVGMFSAATFASNSFTIQHQTPKTETTKSANKTTPKKKKAVKKTKAEKKEKAPAANTKK